MSSSFDPYYKWLGIRPEEQPPNHYRLLGIAIFETDPDVIASAADQRMAHVRSFQTGRHVEQSQRILNEIAAARVCLLNPEKKAAYDASLRQMEVTSVEPSPLDVSPLGLDLGPTKPPLHAPAKRRKIDTSYIMLAAVATVLILAILAVLATRRSSPPPNDQVAAVAPKHAEAVQPVKASEVTPKVEVAQVNDPPVVAPSPPPASMPPIPSPQPERTTTAPKPDMPWISKDAAYIPSSVFEDQNPLPSLLTDEGPRHFGDNFAFQTNPGANPYIIITLNVPCDVSRLYVENRRDMCWERAATLTIWVSLDQKEWTKLWAAEKGEKEWHVDLPKPVRTRYVKLGTVGPDPFHLRTVKLFGQRAPDEPAALAKVEPQEAKARDSRQIVPDEDAQAKGLKLIKEVYGEEYKAAEIPDQKKAFARKLLARAQEVGNDATSKYLLLKLARDVATEGGDRQTAFEAIDRMAEAFQVDAVERKCDVLTSLSKRARTAPEHHAIIRQADELMEAAVKADRFDLVSQLGELAISEATALRDSDLVKRVRTRVNSLRELAAAYGEARKAIEGLKQTPDDPEANLIAGKHYCFVKGDWAKGLPMLAKGSDAALKEVAAQDLRVPTTPDEQVKLGDRWCELADDEEGPVKRAMALRAAEWYSRALPQATGLTRSKVEKRLKELASEAEGPVSTESKSKLAPAITGHFLVGMMQRRTRERKVVWWEFRPDQSVWEKDKQIGQWTATDTQVKVAFSDSSQATFRPKGREAFIGTQVRASGELWGCELQKVFVVAVWEHRWPAGADKLLFWSTGRLVTPDGASLWERKGDTLILRHANGSTDTCTVSPDGKSYKGQNQGGAPISGKLISEK